MSTLSHSVVLVTALLTWPGVASTSGIPGSGQAAAKVSAADAAPFVGEWTLALEGANGPGTFVLTVKVDQDKVTADVVADTLGTQVIREITKADKALLLSYSILYENNPIDAVIRLTPADNGKMNAQMDFAGGAYVMTGTATKKEAIRPAVPPAKETTLAGRS